MRRDLRRQRRVRLVEGGSVSDLKCNRCGASADFEIQTVVTAVSPEGRAAAKTDRVERTLAVCLGCTVELGVPMNALIDSKKAPAS